MLLDLLQDVRDSGIQIFVDNGQLKVRAGRDAMSDDLRARIRANKDALIALLAELGDGVAVSADAPLRPRAEAGRTPLSFAQQRLWLMDDLGVDPAQYNVPVALRVDGAFDTTRAEAALAAIVQRHEVLRSVYASDADGPCQQVRSADDFRLVQTDLRGVDAANRESALAGLLRAEALQPFDLARDLMLRARFIRLADDSGVLALTLHHIASDGWSLDVLMREFALLYAGGVLPPLPVQYGDYAQWQRDLAAGGALERQAAYWQRQLADLPALHALPLDFPRPARKSSNGAAQASRLDAATANRLRELARANGCTVFMLLHAALSLVIAHFGNNPDVVIGTPVANRRQAALEGLIGFFVNTLVLRVDTSGDARFIDFLRRVRDVNIAAQANQDLSFEELVDRLNPPRSLSHSPLFEIMLSLDTVTGSDAQRFPGFTVTPLRGGDTIAKYDLQLKAADTPDGFELNWTYNPQLFAAATIANLADSLLSVLGAVAEDAQTRLDALPMAPEHAHPALLRQGRGRERAGGDSLPARIAAWARRTPDAIAVECGDDRIDYAGLAGCAAAVAQRLRVHGVRGGDRIGLCAARSVDYLIGLCAIWQVGAVYVPLDPLHPPARRAQIVADSGLVALLTDAASRGALAAAAAPVLVIERGHAALPVSETVAGDAPAYVLYTSGSTGTPKGVVVTHAALANLADNLGPDGINDGGLHGRWGWNVSAAFDASLQAICQLAHGGCVVILPDEARFDAHAMRAALARHHVDLMDATPAMAEIWLAGGLDTVLPHLVIGGEAIVPALWQRLVDWQRRHARWAINVYGPTECCVDSTWALIEGEEPCIGSALDNVQLYVVDAAGRLAAPGAIGELWIGGLCVAAGYHAQAALTRERFCSNPFGAGRIYRSGDIVRWRSDGRLHYVGRGDQQIKLRGFRIELGDIEAALRRQSVVRDACVAVCGDEAARRLVAYVVADDVPALTAMLARQLRAELPDYMQPSAIVRLDALPLTPNGKLDRKALPEPARVSEDGAAPSSPTERAIAAIWGEVLRTVVVDIDANFFSLGGNSLLAARVVASIGANLQKKISIRALFEFPSVRGLAAHLDTLAVDADRIVAVPRDAAIALSFAQQRLWFVDRLEGGTPQYNMASAFRVRGPLRTADLRRALDRLLARHEALRTVYVEEEGQPGQRVLPPAAAPLREVDLRSLEPSLRERELRRLVAQQTREPFDLASGPLLRAALLQLDEQEFGFVFVVHHIAADGWSTGLLVDEFTQAYAALSRGEEPVFPALPLQYADYAHWQRTRVDDAALSRQLDYWRTQLAGVPAVHALPLDRPRPAQQDFRGSRVSRGLDAHRSATLRELARTHDVTLFMLLQTAFAALLSRWSGESEIVVGTPIAGRQRAEFARVVGLFVNTLVLRNDVSGNPGFAELLARTRLLALDAYANQDLPFDRLVDVVQPARSLAHAPLFQILFALQEFRSDTPQLPELAFSPLSAGRNSMTVDLELSVVDHGGRLQFDWLYAEALFDEVTVERMAAALDALLAAVADDPQRPLGAIDLCDPADRARIAQWNATARPYPADDCAHDLFERQAAATPDHIAVLDGRDALSYAELDARANQVAHTLRARGIGPETVVGIALPRGVGMLVAVLGVLKAGAAFLPLDMSLPSGRLAYLVGDSGAVALLGDAAAAAMLPPDVPCWELDAIGASGASRLRPPRPAGLGPASLAYVIYTSGSTGQPKGVLVEHRGLASLAEDSRRRLGLDARSRCLQFIAFGFDPFTWDWLYTFAAGATLCLCPAEARTSPEALSDFVQAQRITHATLPAAVLPWLDPAREYALTSIAIGGEAPDEPTAWRWAQRLALYNVYGPTEATICTSMGLVRPGQRPSIGTPFANVTVEIVDDAGLPLPVGVFGELRIGGLGLARGYRGRDEATAAAFVVAADGTRRYRSGDRARWLPSGELDFGGRRDQQIKIRGFRVEIGEIETALSQLPSVRQAAVLAIGDADARRLVAFVRLDADARDSAESLRTALRRQLPDYMVPAQITLCANLPLTVNGKIDRNALAALPLASAPVTPATPTQQRLLAVFAAVLGHGAVDIERSFFDLGGNSLRAVRLAHAINEEFGCALGVRDVFEHASVAAMAARLDSGADGSGAARLEVIGEHGTDTVYLLPGAGLAPASYRALAGALGNRRVCVIEPPQLADPAATLQAAAHACLGLLLADAPQGRIALAGHSVGGSLAFEMARELHRLGRECRLVLLDAAFVADAGGTAFDPARAVEHLASRASAVTRAEQESDAELLARALVAAGLLPRTAAPALVQDLLQRYLQQGRLFHEYRPEAPVTVPALLLQARASRDRRDAVAAWFGAAFAVQTIDADHYSLVGGAAAPTTAAAMRRFFDAADISSFPCQESADEPCS
ncbi:MAG: hypothetical protein AMXMBFR59_37060 [Rhodanobacteraceae bacterium]